MNLKPRKLNITACSLSSRLLIDIFPLMFQGIDVQASVKPTVTFGPVMSGGRDG